jgi:hypothetical protein
VWRERLSGCLQKELLDQIGMKWPNSSTQLTFKLFSKRKKTYTEVDADKAKCSKITIGESIWVSLALYSNFSISLNFKK